MKQRVPYLILAIAAVVGAAMLSAALAQAPARPVAPVARVAVCDIASVFNNYERAKDLSTVFEQRRDSIQKEGDRRGEELKNMQGVLNGLKEGSKEHEKQLEAVMKASMERQVWLKMQEELAVREHRRLTEEMYQEVLNAIAVVAREKGYDLVLYRETVDLASTTTPELLNKIAQRKCLYVNPAIDVTPAVLERINATYRAGSAGGG